MNVILKSEINALANLFYRLEGYNVEMGYDFSKSRHPQEKRMFDMAKVSFDFWQVKFQQRSKNKGSI